MTDVQIIEIMESETAFPPLAPLDGLSSSVQSIRSGHLFMIFLPKPLLKIRE